ncbi:hypothetical protein E2C01_029311 [Portunus trituberculatus]|uniref:Secreted protein n=1 Tax=Portunus trituberculatus TaxID=210409 RepID=A0A5B7EUA6_PORTR|nr:hypothetical protein [Portunus trituberculatus]
MVWSAGGSGHGALLIMGVLCWGRCEIVTCGQTSITVREEWRTAPYPSPPLVFSPHRDDLIPQRRRPTREADTTIKTTTTIITFASYI